MISDKIGILLTNIGTPTSPTVPAVKDYLKNFLSDPRIIKLPTYLWKPILYGFILPFRSKTSAEFYNKIWNEEGSPLLIHTKKIAEKLENVLEIPVAFGMHYSTPTIEDAFKKLYAQGINKIIVFPLFPQYSETTTESTCDKIKAIETQNANTTFYIVRSYSDEPDYLKAIESTIRKAWMQFGKAEHLLFSFHGIPKRYVTLGDAYPNFCFETTHQVAELLGLDQNEYSIAFQSRFSKNGWLAPYTDQVLINLPKKGITDLQVICPGFAVDCLETLEEINIRGREQFLNAGGKTFRYINALNDRDEHINMLASIVLKAAIKSQNDSV